jgi:hypothetical protein
MSRYLGPLALSGLTKIGNAYLPGDGELPSFEALGLNEHVDRVLEDLPSGDRDGLKILLSIFGALPSFLVLGFFSLIESLWNRNIPLGSILLQIRLGMRGIVFSLYYSGLKGKSYSGKTPLEILGFSLDVKRS